MSTALIIHQDCNLHVETPGHAEQRRRLDAVLQALETAALPCVRLEAPLAKREDLLRVHTPEYVDLILGSCPKNGWKQLDPDTALSPGSAEAALRATGAVIMAVDGVMAKEFNTAFCAVRPPGHHARPAKAMGFCLFNGIAIAARYAQQAYRLERVAVIDFDVHHGNGTQEMLNNVHGALYASLHQSPLYPGSGKAEERGQSGQIINVPLPAGTRSHEWRQAYLEHIHPALIRFAPQMIFISAGFDGHRDDPLAQFNLGSADYGWITDKLVNIAMKSAKGRVVSVLEGGYDLGALDRSSVAHMRALCEA